MFACSSEETLDELERVMTYDRLPVTDADRTQFLVILRREVEIVRPDISVDVGRDADDDKFLDVALAGDADYIVSGDRDLLALEPYGGVGIVAPDEFVERLE